MSPAPVLVTGVAGFIGFHIAARLLREGRSVLGIDNLSPYYDPALKRDRLALLQGESGFNFVELDMADATRLRKVFQTHGPRDVMHLAAQAGVRHSIDNPETYVSANLVGFANLLECCRQEQVRHLVFASTSSVYGASGRLPFSVHDPADHPLTLYAATKRSNELMAHAYAHLFGIPTSGVRFFTVYGPWGRPDMSYFLFTRAILRGEPITLYNDGDMDRDFTFVDDVVEGMVRLLDRAAAPAPDWNATSPDPATSRAPFRLYNIGNHRPVGLRTVVDILERRIGRRAIVRLAPMQPGDVLSTCADVADLRSAVDFEPRTGIEEGLGRFVDWYRQRYGA